MVKLASLVIYKWIRFEISVLQVELTGHPHDRLTFSIAIGSRTVGGDCAVTDALFNFVWGATISLQWRHNECDDVSNQRKENIRALRHWPLWGDSTVDRRNPLTKGQQRGKVSIWWHHHDMPLSDRLVLEIYDVAVSSHGNPRVVVTGGIGGCYDDLRCIQWRSWQYDSSRVSVTIDLFSWSLNERSQFALSTMS